MVPDEAAINLPASEISRYIPSSTHCPRAEYEHPVYLTGRKGAWPRLKNAGGSEAGYGRCPEKAKNRPTVGQ